MKKYITIALIPPAPRPLHSGVKDPDVMNRMSAKDLDDVSGGLSEPSRPRPTSDWRFSKSGKPAVRATRTSAPNEPGDGSVWLRSDGGEGRSPAHGSLYRSQRRGLGGEAGTCASCHWAKLEGQPDWRTPGKDGILLASPHEVSSHTWHHGTSLLLEYMLKGEQAAPEARASQDSRAGCPLPRML